MRAERNTSFQIRDKIFPAMLNAFSKVKKHELIIVNDRPKEDNAIYAVSHYCCHDVPYACEVIGKRCWVLAGKQRLNIVSWIAFSLIGTIWVDRKSKKSKRQASERIKRLLRMGQDIIIFPEGTWNMSYSLPIMPLYWGVIDIARETSRPIIPLILEYEENKCYAVFGKWIVVGQEDDKKDKINELRDEMSSLKWNLWEERPRKHREEVTIESFEKELELRFSEYPLLDIEYEKSIVRES